jgi:uncharacterized protein
MDFQINAYDFTDAAAIDRRMAARQAHLDKAKKMKAAGHLIAGGAMLDVTGKMIGSTLYLRFDTRAEVDAYIASDPYTTGKVWDRIEVKTIRLVDL